RRDRPRRARRLHVAPPQVGIRSLESLASGEATEGGGMSARRLAILSACLFAVAGAAAGVAATAPGTPTNVDVSVLPNNDAEDAVAVSPTNPNNVVAMAITFTQAAGLIEGVSFNGGTRWARQLIGGSTADPLGDICCDEQLAWDRYGNLWMTYLLNSNGD